MCQEIFFMEWGGREKNKGGIVMKRLLIWITLFAVMAGGCARNERSALISKKFIDDNTYEIVCRGFPMAETEGIARFESAKRAALMNAYFYTRQTFNDTVFPDRDGDVNRVEVGNDYAVVYYVIKKRDLKKRLR
ncbi:MAG: hypothetical protein CVV44_13100 [Spirochaetae bacterium HGW-Spirochaetae-1]|jgi:hypothetical protein|nr:MAG: hypothetical protein CVV44_13100 [Spirochaetae bacterium HGW-Spirochaetae-1]